MRNKGISALELVVAILVLAVLALVLLPALPWRVDSTRNGQACQNNLKQLWTVCTMYAEESPSLLYPTVQGGEPWHQAGAPAPSNCGAFDGTPDYAMAMAAVYPDYLADLSFLVCPSSTTADLDPGEAVGQLPPQPCNYPLHISNPDVSYVYLGYCIDDGDGAVSGMAGLGEHGFPEDAEAVALGRNALAPAQILCVMKYIRDHANNHAALDRDIDVAAEGFEGAGNGAKDGDPELGPGKTIFRLGSGVYWKFAPRGADWVYRGWIDERLPLMWDVICSDGGTATSSHSPAGVHCLFMDGHVEFIKYRGRFPCSEALAALLGSTGQ